jgi:cell division protein FtsZ
MEVKDLVEVMPDIDYYSNSKAPIIKVLGVGGGGSNAARHMYNTGITGVDFIICNTDKQALESNPIPVKIQLGETGWGAGGIPQVARDAAMASEERIKAALEGTKMVFITAGMGGGTGTGASPIIASIAREMGILTVGIVTYPFDFEEEDKYRLASEGIHELGQNVDALIVIKNEALTSFYPDLTLNNGFAKADDVLLIAAKSIAEIITLESVINVDFNDVNTILRNSGTAIIGSGIAEGEDRAKDAAEAAVNSPLLDTNSVYGAGKILFFVSYSHQNELLMSELKTITNVLSNRTCNMKEKLIWGHGYDDALGEKVRVTVIATNLRGTIPPPPPIRSNYDEESVIVDEIIKEPVAEEEMPPVKENPLFPPADYTLKTSYTTQQSTSENIANRVLTNDELRGKGDKDMEAYFMGQRNKMMQDNKNLFESKMSNYQAGSNGMVECSSAAYLADNAD